MTILSRKSIMRSRETSTAISICCCRLVIVIRLFFLNLSGSQATATLWEDLEGILSVFNNPHIVMRTNTNWFSLPIIFDFHLFLDMVLVKNGKEKGRNEREEGRLSSLQHLSSFILRFVSLRVRLRSFIFRTLYSTTT
jgi:hypothetical protein